MNAVAPTPSSVQLDPSQQLAVELMCTAPFGIVTGGPGTGKTTTLRTALDRLDAERASYELAAPTGKASKRMAEATGRNARTVHRLLEFNPSLGGFQRHEHNPLTCSAVFVDESSMLDVALAAALLRAIGPRTRLVLIGDADQLPPVGPGRVFGDLVDCGDVPVARLTQLHRSALESWIHVNAQRILRGDMLDLSAGRKDFRWFEVEDAAGVLPTVVKLVTETIPRDLEGVPSQVLIPQRPGLAGIELANAQLQAALNPFREGEPFLARGRAGDGNSGKATQLRIGDRVIQTRNDYKLADGQGVFNGELGDIVGIEKGSVTVYFADRGEVRYTLEQANALQHAYALTVHRFQGSEIPWAVVVCHSTHTFILSRQLLYTAITRGKQGVLLVGNRKGIEVALSEKRPPKRNTALVERMRGELA